jgi:sec-independent protein translocase protein TatA
MGGMSIWHWVILLVIVMVLFGAGRIPRVMGDLAKGIKSFKAGMKDEEVAAADDPAKRVEGTTIDAKPGSPAGAAQQPGSTAPKA